jgi:hypothetical protein
LKSSLVWCSRRQWSCKYPHNTGDLVTQARPKCSRIPNHVGTHGLQSRVSKSRLSKARNESRRSIDRASGGNGVVTDARGAASHTGCKLPHTNYKATRTLLTRQPASVHVWQNLSPVCLKICGAVAGLVAESELHTTTDRYSAHWTRKQFSGLFFHLWSSSVFFGQFCDVAKVAMIHGKI